MLQRSLMLKIALPQRGDIIVLINGRHHFRRRAAPPPEPPPAAAKFPSSEIPNTRKQSQASHHPSNEAREKWLIDCPRSPRRRRARSSAHDVSETAAQAVTKRIVLRLCRGELVGAIGATVTLHENALPPNTALFGEAGARAMSRLPNKNLPLTATARQDGWALTKSAKSPVTTLSHRI